MTSPTQSTAEDFHWEDPGVVDLNVQRFAWSKCPACGTRETRVVMTCTDEGQDGVYRADCSCGHRRVWAY